MNLSVLPREITIKRIQELAKASPNEEVCGYVLTLPTKDLLIPAKNIAKKPKWEFQIDPSTKRSFESFLGRYPKAIVTIYHSHVRGITGFSTGDLNSIERCEVEGFYWNWYMYHVQRNTEEWYVPKQNMLKAVA